MTIFSSVNEQSEISLDKGSLFAKRYKIIKRIGKGGIGSVYKAQDTLLTEMVAIKILHAERAENLTIRRRFILETKITRTLNHDNIVRIFDIDLIGDLLYLSMEFIDGHDLKYFI